MNDHIKINKTACLGLLLLSFLVSCTKFLDKKSDQSLQVPSSVADCQALFDNSYTINFNQNNGIGEASADNYYLRDIDYDNLYYEADRSIYHWDKEIFYDVPPGSNDWRNIYSVVNNANIVMETLGKISSGEAGWNTAMGTAYFLRGWAFFTLTVNFANAYDEATAGTDLGIPLRLSSDFNIPSSRATVGASYNEIISDLQQAALYLPQTVTTPLRPSKAAAYALLARTFVAMRNYAKAGLYADSSLALKNTVMDYNGDPGIDLAAESPFKRFNEETIFYESGYSGPLYSACIDSAFYASYDDNDLRKSLFFHYSSNGTIKFYGSYSGSFYEIFSGITTGEMLLTKAECLLRSGSSAAAISLLNNLMTKRWKTGSFVPLTATTADEALNIILYERRKELIFRDIRWMDIKRLNKEGRNITLTRNIKGTTYQLAPNAPAFALPLPAKIIELTGMPQNPH